MNKIVLFLLMLICNTQAMQRYNKNPKEQDRSSFDVDVEKQSPAIDERKSVDLQAARSKIKKAAAAQEKSLRTSLQITTIEAPPLVEKAEIIIVRDLIEAHEAVKGRQEVEQQLKNAQDRNEIDDRFRKKLPSIVYIPEIDQIHLEKLIKRLKPSEQELEDMVELLAELTKKDLTLIKKLCMETLNTLHESPPTSKDDSYMQSTVEALRKAAETKKSISRQNILIGKESDKEILPEVDPVLAAVQKNVRRAHAQELLFDQTKDANTSILLQKLIGDIFEQKLKETHEQLSKTEEQKSRNKWIAGGIGAVATVASAAIAALTAYLGTKKTC